MKVRVINAKAEIDVTRDEFVKLAEQWNKEVGENDYDIAEILANFPDKMTITEDMCDEYEGGFIMYSDHFYEVVTNHSAEPLA